MTMEHGAATATAEPAGLELVAKRSLVTSPIDAFFRPPPRRPARW